MPSVGQRRGEEVSVASLFQFEAFAESGYGVRKVTDGQIGLSESVKKSFEVLFAEPAATLYGKRPPGKIPAGMV